MKTCLEVATQNHFAQPFSNRIRSMFTLGRIPKIFNYQVAVNATRSLSNMPSSSVAEYTKNHQNFLTDIAKVQSPHYINELLNFLILRGDTLVLPTDRKGLIPFLIPISKIVNSSSILCFIRWPTQKDDMDLQLVRTNSAGVQLEALNVKLYCQHIIASMYLSDNRSYLEALSFLSNSHLKFDPSGYETLAKSGKFPSETNFEKRVIMDKYLISKIGYFPDCFERIATDFFNRGSETSALITCEKSASTFYSWGHPTKFHAQLLLKMPNRMKEARDVAKNSLTSPKWTIGYSKQDLDEIIKLAGYSDAAVVGKMHAFRARDPRTKDIEEGVNPIQIILDQAAHLMDAVALGGIENDWESIKPELAEKYEQSGYPALKGFILS